MNPLWLIAAYLVGLAAMKLAQEMCNPDSMRIRDYAVAILFGWILVPLVVYLIVMMSLFIGPQIIWKFIKKAW